MKKSNLFILGIGITLGIAISILFLLHIQIYPRINIQIQHTIESFQTSNIHFLSSDETRDVLLSDEDDYYKRFSKYDFIARKVNSVDEYKEYIKDCPIDPSQEYQTRISNCIQKIHNQLYRFSMDGLDPDKFRKIPLKIGIVSGKKYEHGLAHTRGNVILLSTPILETYDMDKLTGTMSHEMIHIYQKQYPDEISKYLKANKIQEDITLMDPLFRVNPDLNDKFYKDEKGIPYYAKYSNENPKNVSDIVYSQNANQEREHPYEEMAIEFEKRILSKISN